MEQNSTATAWIDAYLDYGRELTAEREQFQEAVLLDALQMETECVHIVRQILDSGLRSPEALSLALDTLRNANELLMNEERAWHALCAKRRFQFALTPLGAWGNQIDYDWSHALGDMAADVHALTGRVLALQTLRA